MRDKAQAELIYHRRVGRLRRRAWKRIGINLFIVWQVFALVIWNMPGQSSLVWQCLGIVRPYMTSTGLMQGWAMFAPEPYKLDVAVEAKITYSDGVVSSWYFPRMAKLSYPTRYTKERWRKYVELIHQDSWSQLWPSAADYAARQNDDRNSAHPVSVELIRHWRYLPEPGQPLPAMQVHSFYKKAIRPEDLR